MQESFPWWKRAVIYQIYPRSFYDTTGNGVGDLQGIIKKLPYLADTLGIDAVWISPFYPSPMKDFGYDVSDYREVDPLFGSLNDFDKLLDSAHQQGLKVIIDLVPNHTSDHHPWFLASRSSPDNPRREWYVWADARDDGAPPNNWLSVFGGSAWEWDEKTGQYYLHSFLKEQPDLNWRNPLVQDAVFNETRFWLEKGVDGFRIDVAHYLMKDPQMRDNPLNTSGNKVIHKTLGEYDSQIHLYDKGHPDNHRVYRDFRVLLDQHSRDQPRMCMGEIHIFTWEEWASYYGKNLDEIHFPINFSLLGVPWKSDAIRDLIIGLEENIPSGAWPNYVLANHDDHRIISRVGGEQARNAALLLLTLRGTPILYYGDEIGMADGDIPPGFDLDPAGFRQPGQGRDPYRTPMQWSSDNWAGFSPAETEGTWLPIAKDYRDVNVKDQLKDPNSLLSFYRGLLTLRKSYPVLQTGQFRPIQNSPEDCFLYIRENGRETILVAINFSSLSHRLDASLLEGGKFLLSTDPNRAAGLDDFTLQPNEGVIVQL